MTNIPHLFVAGAFLIGALASLTLWSRRGVGVKVGALAVAMACLVLLYTSFYTLLARPRPIAFSFLNVETEVLAARLIEGDGIYLWLLLPGTPEPRYYVLPWSRPLAEQLQGAREDAKEGQAVKMRRPFENSLEDREPMFYTEPQPALPPKAEPEAPQVFEGDPT